VLRFHKPGLPLQYAVRKPYATKSTRSHGVALQPVFLFAPL
jgi:hypothetical protein